jgi:hypothetical protein
MVVAINFFNKQLHMNTDFHIHFKYCNNVLIKFWFLNLLSNIFYNTISIYIYIDLHLANAKSIKKAVRFSAMQLVPYLPSVKRFFGLAFQ